MLEKSFGKELMRQTTKPNALWKQRLGVMFCGVLVTAFAFVFDIHFALSIAIGALIILAALFGINSLELIIYEDGFFVKTGKRAEAIRFVDVAEMGYKTATSQEKKVDYLRGYIYFGITKEAIYLPQQSKV